MDVLREYIEERNKNIYIGKLITVSKGIDGKKIKYMIVREDIRDINGKNYCSRCYKNKCYKALDIHGTSIYYNREVIKDSFLENLCRLNVLLEYNKEVKVGQIIRLVSILTSWYLKDSLCEYEVIDISTCHKNHCSNPVLDVCKDNYVYKLKNVNTGMGYIYSNCELNYIIVR